VVEDYLSLAARLSELASQERALANAYSRLAAIYENGVMPPGTDAASAREITDQYKRLAEAEKKAAAAAESVATYHSRVADRVGNASVRTLARHGKQSFAAVGN
jgi:hypothetical protein